MLVLAVGLGRIGVEMGAVWVSKEDLVMKIYSQLFLMVLGYVSHSTQLTFILNLTSCT